MASISPHFPPHSSFFIILTLFYLKEKVGSYRYLLLLLPITGFLLASFEHLLDGFFHCYNHSLVLFRFSSFPYLSFETNTSFISLFPGCYGATISSLALQFVYRYWAVFRPANIKTYFDNNYFIFPISYTFLTGLVWFLGSCLFTRMDEYGLNYLQAEIMESYGVSIRDQPALAFVAYDQNGNLRWENFTGMGIMAILMTIQYLIIVYCALFMGFKMHEKISILSAKMQRMHRQFYYILIIQITSPTITLFSPIAFLLLAPYLDLKTSFPGIISSASSGYPGVECIIMIYMASFYNKALKDFLRNFRFLVCNKKYHGKNPRKKAEKAETSTVKLSVITTAS